MDAADMMLEDSFFNDSLERKQALKAAFTEPCEGVDELECSGKASLNDSLDFEHTQLPFEEVAIVPCDTSINLSNNDEAHFTTCEDFSKTEKGLRCGEKINTCSSQEVESSHDTCQAPGESCTDVLLPDNGSPNKNVGNVEDQRAIETSENTTAGSTHPSSTTNSSQLCPATQLEKVVPLFGQKKKPSFVPPTSKPAHPTEKCKTVPPSDGKAKPLPKDEKGGKTKEVPEKKCVSREDEVEGDQCVPKTTDKKAPHKMKHTTPQPKTSSKHESNREKTERDQKRQQESKIQKNPQDQKVRKKLSEAEKDTKRAQLEQKRREREEEKERKKLDKERKKREAEEKKAEKEKLKKERQMECERRKTEREQKKKEKEMVHKKKQGQKTEGESVPATSDSSKAGGENAMPPEQQSSSQGEEKERGRRKES